MKFFKLIEIFFMIIINCFIIKCFKLNEDDKDLVIKFSKIFTNLEDTENIKNKIAIRMNHLKKMNRMRKNSKN
jgi:hypothetical protein